MGSSFRRFTKSGVKGWRTRMRFNQLASELAFHRSRVSSGVHSPHHDIMAQEAAYLQALQVLINELRAVSFSFYPCINARCPSVSDIYWRGLCKGLHQSWKLVRIELLPSTFDDQGVATLEQRLTCFLIDDCVAVDAGSIAIALTNEQRYKVRDIIVTHPHMDHIASLPIFIDDLYPLLKQPDARSCDAGSDRAARARCFQLECLSSLFRLEERLWASNGIRADSDRSVLFRWPI